MVNLPAEAEIAKAREDFLDFKAKALAATRRASGLRGHIPTLLGSLDEAEAWDEAGEAARKLRAAFERLGGLADRLPPGEGMSESDVRANFDREFDEIGDGSEEDFR